MILDSAAAALLETALKQCLKLDPDAAAAVMALSGKTIAIELRGTGVEFILLFSPQGICVQPQLDGEPDARLSGTPLALARLGLGGDQQNVLFAGDVEISGDTELGQRVKKIIDQLDIDWEEQLSKICGDVLAHQIGRAVRGLGEWAAQSLQTLQQDAAEYLHEEARLLPARQQVEAFLAAVDTLRDDVERLDLRVERLQQSLARETE